MNFDFAQKVNPLLENQDFASAVAVAESNLNSIGVTDFHSIIGKSLLIQNENVTNWINDFYNSATKDLIVAALYFEFTEFDINQDSWEIDGFAYNHDPGLEDLDWLSNVERLLCLFLLRAMKKYKVLSAIIKT